MSARIIIKSDVARLSVRSESGTQNSYDLAQETITIGRSPDNMIRLDDPSVSGRHAELILVGDSCYLKDLDSTNGTRVNGASVTGVQLRPGDRILFGKVDACFEREAAGEAKPLPSREEFHSLPANSNTPPADCANASPFPNRKKTKDATRVAILIAAGLAALAFLGSMLAVLQMRGPTP